MNLAFNKKMVGVHLAISFVFKDYVWMDIWLYIKTKEEVGV